jgi:hypothetical protein
VRVQGVAGSGQELDVAGSRTRPEHEGTIASWLLHCPGQSPAWSEYLLSVIHLRDIPGTPPAHQQWPGATHEVLLTALHPDAHPSPGDPGSWVPLTPVNVCQQIEVPSDDDARDLLRLAAQAVVDGRLPAEPPLAGQVEPWRTVLLKSAAHARGEEHAP